MDSQPHRVPLELDNPKPNPSQTAPSQNTDSSSDPAASTILQPAQIEDIQEQIISALRTCFDPEIPVNIYELGLIYSVDVEPSGAVKVRMTLTSPACPAAGSLPPEVQAKVSSVPGVTAAQVEVVWDPPWNQDRMSEAAKLELGLF